MKTWEVEVQVHAFLASALDGSKWSASRPSCFTPWAKVPGTHWIGGCAGPRAGLDVAANRKQFLTYRESNPRRLACSLVITLTGFLRLVITLIVKVPG